MSTLEVEVGEAGEDVALVVLHGELDFASGESLSPALADLVAHSPNRVVVDLTGLEFVDSREVKMLLAAARAFEADGRSMILVAPTLPVRRALEILHIDETLPIVADRDEALRAGAGTRGGGGAA
jgi:anti-sigma B factor antagonist